jgi:hypothetical protein
LGGNNITPSLNVEEQAKQAGSKQNPVCCLAFFLDPEDGSRKVKQYVD